MERIYRIWLRIPCGIVSIIVLGMILWLTLSPHPTGNFDIPIWGIDKFVHGVMFAILCISVCGDIHKYPKEIVIDRILLYGAILSISFGVATEVLQYLMDFGRSFEYLDILANTLGVSIGIFLTNIFFRKFGTKRPNQCSE